MAESHTGRAPARRESPTNTTGPASPPPLARSVAPLAELQHLAGNSATTALLRGPAGGRDARSSGVSGLGAAVRSAAVPPLAAARAEVQREAHAAGGAATAAPASPGKAAAGGATAGDVGGAEAWLRYMALRGNAPRPAEAVPAVYSGALQALQSAIGGPGPFPAEQLVVDELAFGEGRAMLKRVRSDHDRLTPRAPYDVYPLAELAIDRAQVNFGKGPGSFEGGATQMDQAQVLLQIKSAADDELAAAREAGYIIPKDLLELPSEAQAQFDAAASGWTKRAPSTTRLTTPSDEADLVEFTRHAAETINDMRERRIADIVRQRRAERDALQEAADRQLAELRLVIADRRRAAFAAGDRDTLHKIHDALGEVTGAVNDIKSAAEIITQRVDQLNAAAKLATKAGTEVIKLPAVPSSITNVTGFLEKAHSRIGTAIELLDLAAPAKTKFDEGLKYLKGVDMALEHFGGSHMNPFIKVYVNSYLGPGIKNCVALLGQIADTQRRQDQSVIGEGTQTAAVAWELQQGGLPMYAFLLQVYKVGPLASPSDEAFSYLDTHRRDLEAAVVAKDVKDPMPSSRRTVGVWIARHRTEVWQSIYGSTPEPRGH